ncbi:hypothetical protein J7E79_15645 [Bacillus sp. ISL-40]|uniref:hypothetical protein n=1 Tax=unclassified Bacillus (in: firmicutes) TaxID=185979 RepID=UPI001BE6A1B9|nr:MULTISPECIES: hypothetical protein [unclassified Bacillus (in: firmicutes)]MBT2698832.1 hypothetical protein [Bacillus sp. ISL-40]MBT2720723.1 hypothetical protein [Bacillus sp. ISL-46]MBT2741002.1 hypothetical protein [Bacillus sp. ISL-77]
MKRYWKIISLCIVTVMVIGTFYIQSSLAANENAKIEFEKVSGKEDEVKNLIFYGDYVVGNLNQSLQITSKETINLTNQSLIQELTKNNTVPVLKKLIDQYRTFMRGKEFTPNNFYEDENLVVYASIKAKDSRHSSFDINLLNKKSEETTSIQLAVPKRENYGWMEVVDVQVIDGNLKVITRGFRTEGGNDLNVYTINIDEQKLVNDEIIHSASSVENGWSDIIIINDYNSIQSEKYLLFKTEAYEDKQVQAEGEMELDGEPKLVANEVMVYDIENNKSKKLVVPDEIRGTIGDFSAIFHSTIFIPSQSESGFEVNKYDIEKEKWGKKLTFDLLHNKEDEGAPYIKLMNGKIYIIHSTNNGHTIFIRDLKTGKSLYEGELKVKNTREGQNDFLFQISEIESVQ